MKNLESQYLIEYQTKVEALQARLNEYWPDLPPKHLIQEFYRLMDIVNRLKSEVNHENN